MEGKIDEKGNLYIVRTTDEVFTQTCCIETMFRTDVEGKPSHCGEHCPMFGEPIIQEGCFKLELCKKTISFNKFTDDRHVMDRS